MSEPVTAAELAEALNSVLLIFFQLTQDGEELPESYEMAETLLAKYKAQQAAQSQECTGVAATWCPRCGDCTCPDHTEFASIPSDKCPLHGSASTHDDAQQTEPIKPALTEVEQAAVRVVTAYVGVDGEECDEAVFMLREALRKRGAF